MEFVLSGLQNFVLVIIRQRKLNSQEDLDEFDNDQIKTLLESIKRYTTREIVNIRIIYSNIAVLIICTGCIDQFDGWIHKFNKLIGGPRSVMVKPLECRIVVSEFKLQLLYYVQFQTNTLPNGMNPLILQCMG